MMNNLRRVLGVPDVPTRASVGLLLVRVVFGLTMAMHGRNKIKNPLHWMDKAADPPPAFLQALAAISEFFGGIAIAVGFLTPVAAFGIVCTMVGAILSHRAKGDTYMGKSGGGSYELAALYLFAIAAIAAIGPGRFSLDAFLFKKRS